MKIISQGFLVNFFVPPRPAEGSKKKSIKKMEHKLKEKVQYPSKYSLIGIICHKQQENCALLTETGKNGRPGSSCRKIDNTCLLKSILYLQCTGH